MLENVPGIDALCILVAVSKWTAQDIVQQAQFGLPGGSDVVLEGEEGREDGESSGTTVRGEVSAIYICDVLRRQGMRICRYHHHYHEKQLPV